MWAVLYDFRRRGHRFRRQVQIGPYYADFASLTPALVIEVDGATHTIDEAASNDALRDEYFRSRGFKVLRFWNNDVMSNPDGVAAVLEEALASCMAAPPTPAPSPQGGGRHRGRGVAR